MPYSAAPPDRILVLSDLHMAAGTPDPARGSLECFFHDEEVAALLERAGARWARRGRRGALVLNGDVVDFVRVVELPSDQSEVRAWRELLAAARVPISPLRLAAAAAGRFTAAERRYGPGAGEADAIWKLWLVARAHPRLFAVLAEWCADGHELVIVRGNHDPEWGWPGARRAFREVLRQHGAPALERRQVRFRLHAYRRANLHVEHGHLVDWTSAVPGRFARARGPDLQVPFGTLVNRYLLNPIERAAGRGPAVPSSLHLKRRVQQERSWLWRQLLRNASRDIPAFGRATWHLWHGRVLRWWPALVGEALALAVLVLSFLWPELLDALRLDSVSTRAGTALLALATPHLGLLLVEVLGALRDDPRQLVRARARQAAGALRGFAGTERIVIMGHTHHPELTRWRAANGSIVYANPSSWLGGEGPQGSPHLVWCALRRGRYRRPRLLRLLPGAGRCRTAARR